MKTENKPAHEFRCGTAKATIWKRDSANGTFHVVTFRRCYRQDGTWLETDSFSFREMRALSTVLKMARAWMEEHGETEKGEE